MRSIITVVALASLAYAFGADTTEYCCPDAKKCLTPSTQQCDPSAAGPAYIALESFDKPSHRWHSENDPVMGGRSSSSVEVTHGYADYKGSCRIVPSLNAPGFTIAMTETPLLHGKFPDASSMDGLTLSVRQVGSNYSGYKIAFCDSRNYYRCQFSSFKADLSVPASSNGDFQEVFIPWSKFSDKWSASTGKHTAEDPPKADSLKSISQLQIWTEAVEGDFHLQVQSIRASKSASAASCPADFPVCCPVTKLCVKPGADCVAPPACSSSEYCCPDAKHCLTASKISCAADPKACDKTGLPTCCPLTKLCVKVGAACESPCGKVSNSSNVVV